MDLKEAFGDLNEEVKVYLCDSHRPMRYENARSDQIVVIDDGTIDNKIKQLEESDEDSEVATDVNPVTSVSKEEPVDPYSDSGSDSD